MATNNAVNTTLSGQSGTGAFAGNISPSFTTPSLGAAAASSVNFGGGALTTYIPRTVWTPTITFATPGDLSVAYASQTGRYERIGQTVSFIAVVVFTPTYTTASGQLSISNMPIASSFDQPNVCVMYTGVTYPAGVTNIFCMTATATTSLKIWGQGSATNVAPIVAANMVSGVQVTLSVSGVYYVQ